MRCLIYGVNILLIACSTWLFFNNDYMTPRDYTVTVIDKFKEERCHKHGCNLYLKGLFKTVDGDFFDLDLTMASYNRLVIGGTAVFEERPFDIKQTPKENILYFFGPVVLFSITLVVLGVTLLYMYERYRIRQRLRNAYNLPHL